MGKHEAIYQGYQMLIRNTFPDITQEHEEFLMSIMTEAIRRVEKSHGQNYQLEDVIKMFNHICTITDPDNPNSYLNQIN